MYASSIKVRCGDGEAGKLRLLLQRSEVLGTTAVAGEDARVPKTGRVWGVVSCRRSGFPARPTETGIIYGLAVAMAKLGSFAS
ncbi:MAG: hypothetical protein IJR26_11345 [Bacteroidales bacterium]|nr:hypothetical protein [Bacteroidales bacterium]